MTHHRSGFTPLDPESSGLEASDGKGFSSKPNRILALTGGNLTGFTKIEFILVFGLVGFVVFGMFIFYLRLPYASENFVPDDSILQPTTSSVSIIAPNGGEVLEAGQTFEVKWRGTRVQNVLLSLVQGGEDRGRIAASALPAGLRSYTWKVPTDIVRGFGEEGYRIFISADGAPEIRDESDAPFTIRLSSDADGVGTMREQACPSPGPACPSPKIAECKDGKWICVGPAEGLGPASPGG